MTYAVTHATPAPFAHPRSATLVLVRHGQAAGNRELRYLGTTDAPLTALGLEQARQLAGACGIYSATALYSSPLARARDTAAAIAAALNLAPAVREELREGDFGAWEGLTRAEALARDPKLLAAWEAGGESAPPDGERPSALRERAVACADALAARHPGETILLVSHVGPIKALICAALELPPAGARRMWLDPASLSIIDWRLGVSGASSGLLRLFNSTAHLRAPDRSLGAGHQGE